MAEKPDPTKEPAFQQVIQTFLNTPPKPRTGKGEKKTARKPKGRDARANSAGS
jgi:hypothetical protein